MEDDEEKDVAEVGLNFGEEDGDLDAFKPDNLRKQALQNLKEVR